MTTSDLWGEDMAVRYDRESAAMFDPDVLGPTLDVLQRLAGDGPACEFAIGTGRVGLALAARGVPVTGIELSAAMLAQLRDKPGGADLPVVLGDMADTVAPGAGGFALVYLVFNTLSNLRTQAEQVRCFRNAARHLRPGGRFVIELWVPGLRLLPPGAPAVAGSIDDAHLTFDTYDLATQACETHHYVREPDGGVRASTGHFRYAWPAECDLMAQLAGLELESRWADWDLAPFTSEGRSHVSVWRKPG